MRSIMDANTAILIAGATLIAAVFGGVNAAGLTIGGGLVVAGIVGALAKLKPRESPIDVWHVVRANDDAFIDVLAVNGTWTDAASRTFAPESYRERSVALAVVRFLRSQSGREDIDIIRGDDLDAAARVRCHVNKSTTGRDSRRT